MDRRFLCADAAKIGGLQATLIYAEMGWPVFALSPSRRPLQLCRRCNEPGSDHDREACTCLRCHGFYAATVAPARIRQMFGSRPDHPIGLRTGAASGTVVIDVDPRHGGDVTMAALARDVALPPTLRQDTGGGGQHLVFAHPGGWVPSRVNGLGPGVDIKADGGYVVLAPSIHPETGKRYAWATGANDAIVVAPLPGQLLDRLRALDRTHPATTRATSAQPRLASAVPAPTARRGLAALKVLVATVLRAEPGNRNACLFWAASRAATDISRRKYTREAAVASLLAAARETGLTPSEASATITSAFRGIGGV